MEHLIEWILGFIVTVLLGTVTVGMALRRTFVFRNEFENHIKGCRDLMEKDREIQNGSLKMRDETIKRLEQKIDETKGEIVATRQEFTRKICGIENMVQAILTKLDIPHREAGQS